MTTPLTIYESVQEYYTQRINDTSYFCKTDGADCCSPSYEAGLIETLPESITNQSFGCGDPVTIAGLNPGEVVLDLGSGAGMDSFLAALQVGEKGKVIGVDMTSAMLEKAISNRTKLGLNNVDFREGHIENLPVESNSIDVIISNCVINLSPDKAAVFREAFRVLKPGGRIAFSDMVVEGHPDQPFEPDPLTWSACITGAIEVKLYRDLMHEAGFADIEVVDKSGSFTFENARLFSARITANKPA